MSADGADGAPAGGSPGAASLAELSAGLAAGASAELEPLLRRAAETAGPAAVEEAILQSHLFLGFPAALEGLRAWRRLRGDGERTAGIGAGDAGGPETVEGEDPAGWGARGEEVCRRVYGSAYEGLRRNVRRLHPDLDAWMIRDGYGKVLGREGLDLATRELCIVATLAADGSPRGPLHSHLRGALRVGAEPEAVEEALELGLERRPDGRGKQDARELWRGVRDRRRSRGSESSE